MWVAINIGLFSFTYWNYGITKKYTYLRKVVKVSMSVNHSDMFNVRFGNSQAYCDLPELHFYSEMLLIATILHGSLLIQSSLSFGQSF